MSSPPLDQATQYSKGASVEAEIVRQERGPKLIVFKFRKRKRSRKKQGHRQNLTAVKITGVK